MPLQPDTSVSPASENHYENVLASARQAHTAKAQALSEISHQRSQSSLSEREQMILEEERHRRIQKAEAARGEPSDLA